LQCNARRRNDERTQRHLPEDERIGHDERDEHAMNTVE